MDHSPKSYSTLLEACEFLLKILRLSSFSPSDNFFSNLGRLLLFWYFRTCPRKPLMGSLWDGGGRQAQITGIAILGFDLGRFFFFPPCLPVLLQSASHRDACLLGSWANGLSPRCSPESESWWLCTILANCHGAGGRGVFSPVSLSTLCASTELICLKEAVVSSEEDLCHLIAPLRPVIVVCVKRWHLWSDWGRDLWGQKAAFVFC